MESSKLYFDNHKLVEDELMEDGFFDPGRHAGDGSKLPNLEELRNEKFMRKGEREVILVDGQRDEKLAEFLKTVRETLRPLTDERERAKRLAQLVGDRLGGNRSDILEKSLREIAGRSTRVVPLGELTFGVCRHRALLFKYCADRIAGMRCRLVRGEYRVGDSGGGHAWNVVMLGANTPWLCDVMHNPGHLYEEDSVKAMHYKRLDERGRRDGDGGGGAGMASIAPPALDEELTHLAQYELRPGDLEEPDGASDVVLGEGGFGQVRKNKLHGYTGFVAVKRLLPEKKPSAEEIHDFKRELVTLFGLRHQHVSLAYGFSSQPDDMFLAMEFAAGGSLCDALHGGSPEDKSWLRWENSGRRVMEHAASGLYYLHTRRPPLIHRDIKSANLLLSARGDPNVVAKIADFGAVKEKARTFVSVRGPRTAAYAAPEINSFRNKQDEKVDVFAWGVLTWELLSRQKPWEDGERSRPADAPADAVTTYEKCVSCTASDRPSSAWLVQWFEETRAAAEETRRKAEDAARDAEDERRREAEKERIRAIEVKAARQVNEAEAKLGLAEEEKRRLVERVRALEIEQQNACDDDGSITPSRRNQNVRADGGELGSDVNAEPVGNAEPAKMVRNVGEDQFNSGQLAGVMEGLLKDKEFLNLLWIPTTADSEGESSQDDSYSRSHIAGLR